jgi:hypothetical protein
MLLDFTTPFNWLRAGFFRQSASPPIPLPNQSCPLASPDAPLPAWVAQDPIVQQYRALIGDLPWASFPERPHDRPWPALRPSRALRRRLPDQAARGQTLHE